MTRRTAPDPQATPPDAVATGMPAPRETTSPADHRRLLPSVALITGAVTAFMSLNHRSDPDTRWNLRAGQSVLDTGRFVGPEPWVRFAARPFVLTEWPSDAGFSLMQAP